MRRRPAGKARGGMTEPTCGPLRDGRRDPAGGSPRPVASVAPRDRSLAIRSIVDRVVDGPLRGAGVRPSGPPRTPVGGASAAGTDPSGRPRGPSDLVATSQHPSTRSGEGRGATPPGATRLARHSKGLILAQNERWRRGLGMQVERAARPVAQG